MSSAAETPLRDRREAVVVEHMESENRHDFDATIDTFGHPRIIPISTSEEFAAALPETATFHRVAQAGHVQSWNVEPPRYERWVGSSCVVMT